jgi:IS605 OrfB family transposase
MKPKKKIKSQKDFEIEIKNKSEQILGKYNKFLKKEFEKLIKNINFEKQKFDFGKKIIENKNNIWCPTQDTECKKIYVNSWFSIKESQIFSVPHKDTVHNLIEKEIVEFKAQEIILELTEEQKKIIDKWLYLYMEMYNITLKYIKNTINTDSKCLNFINTRKKLLNEKRNLIKNSNIKVHDIDYAIKLACTNYKSALTNLRNGNIKKFRIRYWSPNKIVKVMDMEKDNFKKNTIRGNILGDVRGYYNGKKFNFNKIKSDCRLQKNGDKYFLFVPTEIDKIDKNEYQNKNISIDLGVRTFATCITENKVVKIGEKCQNKISDYINRKDSILDNENIDKEIKKKNELMINRKINNLVDEMHWKSINYLIKNYETILIGDLNVKSIVKRGGNLSNMTKRTALSLKFYDFKQKLIYKCNANNTNLGIINEWFTSKMCSLCGNIDENLGGNKIYNCKKCKSCLDRDINGARNIYIKSII